MAVLPNPHAQLAAPGDAPLDQAYFWQRMSRFIREDDVLVVENGTSGAAVGGMRMPDGVKVVNQPIWGSIGYTLPALLGTLMAAPQRRHMLFIGDGSFQLTAQEVSTLLRYEQKPIIFLINNDGYTIERYILGENSSYNDIGPWTTPNCRRCLIPRRGRSARRWKPASSWSWRWSTLHVRKRWRLSRSNCR
ncbi:Alpha-keto-acid decarboxylase [Serratia rubidaea]|uniref:Alpha-keto-acid decarboxylase n=1 Tax=Serratia rubidaea TaxID=61652 RepID=A0A3S4H879_SERRU|nr:Alpha-keto-acid decarboxylase [Serratia rubidaea]